MTNTFPKNLICLRDTVQLSRIKYHRNGYFYYLYSFQLSLDQIIVIRIRANNFYGQNNIVKTIL